MKKYTHFNSKDRKEVFLMKKEGKGTAMIAQELGKNRSSVWRELNRNTRDLSTGYLPDQAQALASARRTQGASKIERDEELKNEIISKLKKKLSPEMIAGRMKQQKSEKCVSHETIYRHIYSKKGMALGLYKHLMKARSKRGSLYGRKVKSSPIKDRVSIHDRPKNIETRSEVGHFEGDLTFFEGSKSVNIGVIVERKTRFVQLTLNKSKHTTIVMKGMFNKLAKMPAFVRKTITFDNGLEFARHTLLKHVGIKSFFCDKHSPWQKGQVEQMNVFLHRYLPKRSNANAFSSQKIEEVENLLNNLPRKCLGFKTPAEAFYEQVLQNVALQT